MAKNLQSGTYKELYQDYSGLMSFTVKLSPNFGQISQFLRRNVVKNVANLSKNPGIYS